MALRDQPYLPLYVQDFLTDEKLIECSASATGVYIRVMCIMHKSDPYGMILLKQKDKQTSSTIQNFALKLIKSLPYDLDVIKSGLEELINEDVLQIEDDKLIQKRMVKDFSISNKRAEAGKKGGEKTQSAKAKDEAKHQANSENENENININKECLLKERETEFKESVKQYSNQYPVNMLKSFCDYWTEPNKSKTKMRFELEKTFEIGRRLVTWSSRDKTFIKTEHAQSEPAYYKPLPKL